MTYLPPELPVTNTTHTVIHRFSFVLAGRAGAPPVDARLHYRRNDPYAITMYIHGGSHGPVEWKFARDLLAEGLVQVAGIGDVRIHPAVDVNGNVIIELASPDGRSTLLCSSEELAGFLRKTFEVVAMGHEHAHLSLDSALVALLRN